MSFMLAPMALQGQPPERILTAVIKTHVLDGSAQTGCALASPALRGSYAPAFDAPLGGDFYNIDTIA
jgi:hypothetical protein